MKKILVLSSIAAASALFTACAAVGVAPVTGVLYTDTSSPVAVGSGTGSKEGRATCTSILGWIATGDCSVKAAASAGGVGQIKSVDYKTKSMLGIYAEVTTIVRGN